MAIWKKFNGNAGGEVSEHNEHRTVIFGWNVRIYSDRYGDVWNYCVDKGEPMFLWASNLCEAQTETEKEVNRLADKTLWG